MSAWRPKTEPTTDEVARAKAWLVNPSWHLGVLETVGNVQYRGAMHPNYPNQPPGQHRGVEVWTSDTMPAPATPINPSNDEPARQAVLAEATKRGWPAAELDASVAIESGWKPGAHNVQRFGGLIGFSPSFATKHVGSPEKLWALSIAEQAPLVGAYFDEVMGMGKHWQQPGDTYLALAAPAFIGASDSTVVYARGTKAWEQNPGWRGADGEITAGSIRALLLRKMSRGPMPLPKGPPSPKALQSPSEWLSWLCTCLARDSAAGRAASLGPSAFAGLLALQEQLGAEGLYHGKLDGNFGPLTLAALQAKGWVA